MKKLAGLLLALLIAATGLRVSGEGGVYASGEDWRIVMGEDLSDAQRGRILESLGIDSGADEERRLSLSMEEVLGHFDGRIPKELIGERALCCVYIKLLREGGGLSVTTHNISGCTEEMYENVLLTVGITDAKVCVTAPAEDSGLAALVGVYKAYESLTGQPMDEARKFAGVEELIASDMLGQSIGAEAAPSIIAELKRLLDVAPDMTDAELGERIREIAEEYNITLSESDVDMLLDLLRTLENADSTMRLYERVSGYASSAATGWQRFMNFIVKLVSTLGEFFNRLFGFFGEVLSRISA